MKLTKFDEFDSLLKGLQYVDAQNPNECYYWSNPTVESECVKVNYDFSNPYPFLLVNIGSGVSVLAVYSPSNYKRISGTRYVYNLFYLLNHSENRSEITNKIICCLLIIVVANMKRSL